MRWVSSALSVFLASGCFIDRSGVGTDSLEAGARPDVGNESPVDSGRSDSTPMDANPRDAPATDSSSAIDSGSRIDASSLDASAVDASSVDARPAPEWVVVETLNIPCTTSTARRSDTILVEGRQWRLRARGTCRVAPGIPMDADWFDFPDSTTDALASIDPAIGVNDPIVDMDTSPDWGEYRSDHVYEIDFEPTGSVISVRFHDGNYGNNGGGLQLDILELR